jgi:RNA polymerase sigma-70 factor (sigma-E family)
VHLNGMTDDSVPGPRHEADPPGSFRAYVRARRPALRRTAYLICGDWHLAEDLVQDTLAQLYVHWPRLTSPSGGVTSIDAYVRRMLVNGHLQTRRRPWRREVPTGFDTPPHGATGRAEELATEPDDGTRAALHRALAGLGPSQRTVVVLRYWEDLSVEETARTLGCSTGNVKSQAARGLAHLRSVLAADALEGGRP